MVLTWLYPPLEVGVEVDTLVRVDCMASSGRRHLRDARCEGACWWEINPRFEPAPPLWLQAGRGGTGCPALAETKLGGSGEAQVGAQDN